jgi:2-keto-4-pentenoate hydratase
MNDAIAEQFVRARLDATALPDFPGSIPATLNTAYAYQDRAIALWPDFVAGWKVGRIGEPWLERLGEDRLVGPIFRRGIRLAPPEQLVEFPVFEGGFAAVEAEFVFRLGVDAPSDKVQWTPDEAARIAMALHIGIETAGSPLATINELGGAVVVTDFGNNAGLLLGPVIPEWRTRPFESLKTETFIEGKSVGRGGALSLPGGPFAALSITQGSWVGRMTLSTLPGLARSTSRGSTSRVLPGDTRGPAGGGLCTGAVLVAAGGVEDRWMRF